MEALIETAAPADERESRGASVRALDRAMSILKCLAQAPGGLTLTELSRAVGLHKATVLRFLRTLERGEFVAMASGGKIWRPGLAFLDIRMSTLGRHDIREIARPVMEAASAQANETAQLALFADDGIVYIEKVEPAEQLLRIHTQIGSRRPMHCTALGKAMAAFREPRDVERVIQLAGMARCTPQTITSPSAFQEELARVRRNGYAIDDREYNELVVCVAAPIRDAKGKVIAAVSLSTFGIPVASARFQELIPIAVAAADRISHGMGWAGESETAKPRRHAMA